MWVCSLLVGKNVCTKKPAAEEICIKAEKEGCAIDSLLMPGVCETYQFINCFYVFILIEIYQMKTVPLTSFGGLSSPSKRGSYTPERWSSWLPSKGWASAHRVPRLPNFVILGKALISLSLSFLP